MKVRDIGGGLEIYLERLAIGTILRTVSMRHKFVFHAAGGPIPTDMLHSISAAYVDVWSIVEFCNQHEKAAVPRHLAHYIGV